MSYDVRINGAFIKLKNKHERKVMSPWFVCLVATPVIFLSVVILQLSLLLRDRYVVFEPLPVLCPINM